MEVNIGGLVMSNPVTTASGTFGYGLDYMDFYDVNQLGAVTVKSITEKKREGNPPPRIVETPAGILNSIGLANPGIDYFINDTLRELDIIKVPLIVSIAGDNVDEYVRLAQKLNAHEKVEALEVNISCPNVEHGGLEFAVNAGIVKDMVSEINKVSDLPLIIKLSPNVTNVVHIAEAALEGGADALALINTLVGMDIDIDQRRPVLNNKVGGLAGPAVRPVAVRMVYEVYSAFKVPIIGMGGICSYKDALQFIMAGASVVGVGTYNFVNPTAPVEIIEGLEEFCRREGVSDINSLIGCAVN